jgi:hypothetical protein
MDDSKNVFHDFADGSGGGVLDLVIRVRGVSRQDAFKWLADFVGMPLQDQPLSTEQRQRWARERQLIEQHLPEAQYWRRAMVKLTDELLDSLKAALFDSTLPWPEVNEIYRTERLLARLRRMDGAGLVTEYCSQAKKQPHITAYMVELAIKEERAAVLEFFGISKATV